MSWSKFFNKAQYIIISAFGKFFVFKIFPLIFLINKFLLIFFLNLNFLAFFEKTIISILFYNFFLRKKSTIDFPKNPVPPIISTFFFKCINVGL
jgi:hypothetical protein